MPAALPSRRQAVLLGDLDPFRPSPERPVRVRARSLSADTHFEPHAHPWAQLAYCASGLLEVTAARGPAEDEDEVTFIVPPSRAVWIAPGARHHITVIEAAQFRTLYVDAKAAPAGWTDCRVLMVSALLRELIGALDALPVSAMSAIGVITAQGPAPREGLLASLVLDELAQSTTQALGVPLPHPRHGDKRLRALCEAVLRNPSGHATLAAWATGVGASERTLTRLFRDELGLTYWQWRQQVLLAHALPLLARGTPVSQVASLSGYASESAFSAMFKAAMGQPPSHFRSHA